MLVTYTGKDLDALVQSANALKETEIHNGDAVFKVRLEIVCTNTILQGHNGEFILLVTYKQI